MLPTGVNQVQVAVASRHNAPGDLSHLISKLDNWINHLIASYENKKISCLVLRERLGSYYPDDFLGSFYYVVVDELPFPEIKELQKYKKLFDKEENYEAADAITYKNTYFILQKSADKLATHFHELVHVQQWKVLGDNNFLSRYLSELITHDKHSDLPLEKMAYELVTKFKHNQPIHNLLESIRLELQNDT